MIFKNVFRFLFFCSGLALALSCQTNAVESGARSEAQVFVENLGIGYNLGNTLDACGGGSRGGKIENFEVAWGAPVTNKAMFEGLKARGFNLVRIPVAWSNLVGEDNQINPELLDRVEEVVNMVIETDMYAIINIHWDGGWICKIPVNYDEGMERYIRYWTQISERFKDYDDHLIFESMNEEGHFEDIWDHWSNSGDKKSAFGLLNYINQTFVDLVRGSGGNNKKRYLLIAGYATDFGNSSDSLYRMPDDRASHLMLSLHYYSPATFAIISEDVSWGKNRSTWGTSGDYAQLKDDMGSIKKHFIDKGIPVIIGEYGCPVENKEPESVRKYITAVATSIWDIGACPVLWSGGAPDIYNRISCEFTDPLIGDMYQELSEKER